MLRDRFMRVVRAGRIKLAGAPEERRKKNDVHAHEREQHPRTNRFRAPVQVGVRSLVHSSRFCGRSARGSSFKSSSFSAKNSAVAAELRGCMTMSHPWAISPRCNLRISRRRRRIRLRQTAFPSAFLMLHPNRLTSRPLGRRKTVSSRLVRRRPSLYTASYSVRCTSRQARGRLSRAASDAREAMTPFLAALRKDLPSTLALHAFAKAVFLVTATHMRLIRPLRQRCFSSVLGSFAPGILARRIGRAASETHHVLKPND
jgi:hypothetical protein